MTAPNFTDAAATSGMRQPHRVARMVGVVANVLCVSTLLTLLAKHWWLACMLSDLRMQLAIGLLVLAVALACCGRWKSAVLQLLCLGWHLSWLASGLPAVATGETLAGRSLTLTTANVYTGNHRYAEVQAELLQGDSDVVAVLELSTELARHLSQEFAQRYPYAIIEPQDPGNFGIGLYSKLPFRQSRVLDLVNDSVPSIAATVICEGQPVHLLATHTLPPVGAFACQHRNNHLRLVAEYVQGHQQRDPDVPVVVMGDLNLTPWSPIFHDLLAEGRLTSAAAGRGWTPTWYGYPMFPFGLLLDHVLMTDGLRCQSYVVGRDVGSDHRFVTAKLILPSPETQTGPQLSLQP